MKILGLSLIFFSFLVIICRNPIYSLFCLILAFINTALIFMSVNIEFLALILLIVYAGAVSILFLFIILCLNFENTDFIRMGENEFSPLTTLLSIELLLSVLTYTSTVTDDMNCVVNELFMSPEHVYKDKILNILSDVQLVGQYLYFHYPVVSILCAFILLIAMIGAVILTKR